MTDVMLVSMPFANPLYPSIGLSLLKAGLAEQNVTVRIEYFTVAFLELIGEGRYFRIASNDGFAQSDLVGEWVFAQELRPQSPEDEAAYVDEILTRGRAGHAGLAPLRTQIACVNHARARAGAFLDACLERLVAERPRIVGFTSVFQQHAASLALARRLKEAMPSVVVVFGGANCEGPMGAETLRQFPFVDAVVSGEGDLVFPDVVRHVLAGQPVPSLPGVRTRARLAFELAEGCVPSAPSVQNLDDLPYPDYSDFFEQVEGSALRVSGRCGVFAETSRGCWWGERHHCTFCGLNGTTMAFRSKSPARALAELEWLSAKHPGADIQIVDNILDHAYLKTLLPDLAARGLKLGLFFETKSNLKKDDVRLLLAAGVNAIQPGIESFSDAVLTLTKKGVSGLQNIQLLKWCKELDMAIFWNLLWGFANEPPEDYERMAALVPALLHLQPPYGTSRLRLDRFSPNFVRARDMGYADVRPLPAYRHVYGLAEPALHNLAYYFAYRLADGRDPETYAAPLLRRVRAWHRQHPSSDLFFADTGRHLLVWDLRHSNARSSGSLRVLEGVDRLLYLACDAICGLDRLVKIARAEGDYTSNDISLRLAPLVREGLTLQSGHRYLALAVPLGTYRPSSAVIDRFHQVVAELGAAPTRDGYVVSLDTLGRSPRGRAASPSRRRAPKGATELSPSQFTVTHDRELVIRP